MKKRSAWKWILGIFGVLFLIGLIVPRTPRTTDTEPSGRFVMPESVLAPEPVVTMSEYNRIKTGQSWAQVREIIGAKGSEISRSELAGYTTVMYSWTNSNGSNMNAMFQGGSGTIPKLVSKAQFGLK